MDAWADPAVIMKIVSILRWIESAVRTVTFLTIFIPVFVLWIIIAGLIGIPLIDEFDFWMQLELFVRTLIIPVGFYFVVVLLPALAETLLLLETIRLNVLQARKIKDGVMKTWRKSRSSL